MGLGATCRGAVGMPWLGTEMSLSKSVQGRFKICAAASAPGPTANTARTGRLPKLVLRVP